MPNAPEYREVRVIGLDGANGLLSDVLIELRKNGYRGHLDNDDASLSAGPEARPVGEIFPPERRKELRESGVYIQEL